MLVNICSIVGYVTDSLKQTLRMQAATQITLKDITQRLIKLENAIKGRALKLSGNDDVLIAEFLPLTTTDRIQDIDILLKNTEEAVTQFVCIWV